MPSDPALPAGTRLVHIGPHRTGTAAVQGAFRLARARLAERGVGYVAERPHWDAMVAAVEAAGSDRVVISGESVADGDDRAVRRVVDDLGGSRVHVVVTLRPLSMSVAAQWQQQVQGRMRTGYDEWLRAMLDAAPADEASPGAPPPGEPAPAFWGRHDRLVRRWVDATGRPGGVTVVVADETGEELFLRTFETLLGLPGGFLVPEDRPHDRSLSQVETELVRRLNHEFADRNWPDRVHSRYVGLGAVRQLKTGRRPPAGEPPTSTPAWALERAARIGADAADEISTMGVRVVGDLSDLGRLPATPQAPEPPAAAEAVDGGDREVPVTVAVQAVVGALVAGGDADPAKLPVEDRRIHDVTAADLVRVLLQRGRRRLRPSLRPRRDRH